MAKIITYDAPTNRIYADGGTSGDRIMMANILAADVAGGWGVFTNPLNLTYLSTAGLHFGSNSATFWRLNQQVLVVDTYAGGGPSTEPIYNYANADADIDDGVIACTHTSLKVPYLRGTVHADWSVFWDYNDWCRIRADGENRWRRCLLWFGRLLEPYGGTEFVQSVFHGLVRAMGSFTAASTDNVYDKLATGVSARTFRGGAVLGEFFADQGDIICIDMDLSAATPRAGGSYSAYEKFTFARPVQDEVGNPRAGHTVTITDGEATEVANYVTNAAGLPAAEVLLTTRRWYGSSEVLTDYNPFTVVVEGDADYQTYTEIVTIDNPQEDAISLLDWSESPAESDVEGGVSYAEGTRTGNVVLPSEDNTRDGVGFGSGGAEYEGNLELASEDDTRDGVGFGSGGAEYEGNLEVPVVGSVRSGVAFDSSGSLTGTFVGLAHYLAVDVREPEIEVHVEEPVITVEVR